MLEAEADEARARWGCPAAGLAPPDPLAPACAEALEAVARLTGAGGFTTCPLAATRAPAVARACRAHDWREKGELRAVEPAPSMALVEALRTLDDALAARRRHEEKHPPRRPDAPE